MVGMYRLSTHGGGSRPSYSAPKALHVTGERDRRTPTQSPVMNKPKKAIEVKPDKLLPLDSMDDDDFDDFK